MVTTHQNADHDSDDRPDDAACSIRRETAKGVLASEGVRSRQPHGLLGQYPKKEAREMGNMSGKIQAEHCPPRASREGSSIVETGTMSHLQDKTPTKDPSSPFSKHDFTGITRVSHAHKLDLKVDHDPSSGISEETKTQSGNESRYNA